MDARLIQALGAYTHDASEIEFNARMILEYLQGKLPEASTADVLEWANDIAELADTLKASLESDLGQPISQIPMR